MWYTNAHTPHSVHILYPLSRSICDSLAFHCLFSLSVTLVQCECGYTFTQAHMYTAHRLRPPFIFDPLTWAPRDSQVTGFLVHALSVLVHALSAEQHRGLADLMRNRMEGHVDKACCGRTRWSLGVGAPVIKPAFKNPLGDPLGQLRLGMVEHDLHGKLQWRNTCDVVGAKYGMVDLDWTVSLVNLFFSSSAQAEPEFYGKIGNFSDNLYWLWLHASGDMWLK